MAVVTPLNNFLGPEGDTVTVPYPLLSPKSRIRHSPSAVLLLWHSLYCQ